MRMMGMLIFVIVCVLFFLGCAPKGWVPTAADWNRANSVIGVSAWDSGRDIETRDHQRR